MRFVQYRHSANSVLAKFHFTNEEMNYLAQGLEFIPKLRVSGTIADGLLIWLEAKGNAMRAISGQETAGAVMASQLKSRQVSYPIRYFEPKRVLENGRNALRMPGIPELSETFNPPRVADSKDMRVKMLPAGATAAMAAAERVAAPALTGEALMRAEERRRIQHGLSTPLDDSFRKEPPGLPARPAPPAPPERGPGPEEKTWRVAGERPEEWKPPEAKAPPVNGIADLVTAIAMVNEAADRAGPDVRLFVDGNKIRAKRELRTYEDLT